MSKKYRYTKLNNFKKYDSWVGPNEINNIHLKSFDLLKEKGYSNMLGSLDLQETDLYGGEKVKFKGGIFYKDEKLLFFNLGMIFYKSEFEESKSFFFGTKLSEKPKKALKMLYHFKTDIYENEISGWGYCGGMDFNKVNDEGFEYSTKTYYYGRSYTGVVTIKNKVIHECLQEIQKHRLGLEEQKRQEFHKKEKEKRERLNEEKKLRGQQKHFKNLERKKVLQEGVTKFINEFDSDKDGIIDFNQGGDDFMNLLKKHQKTIIQVDQNHITKLIQVSNYLKTKRGNIQTQFEKIKNSRNSKQLNEFSGILKNQIDTFNLLNYNSLIIIISLVEGDLITFNEIYLTFDKLNIFNSNWENQVSDKLNNIDSKLDEVIYSINKMELSIVNEILGMSIMNQVQMNRLNKNVKEGNMMIDENLSRLNSSLSSNLKSIDSTLKVGNLISTINTYQNYKINKNTKNLRK